MDPLLLSADDRQRAPKSGFRAREFWRLLALTRPYRRSLILGLLATVAFAGLHIGLSVSIIQAVAMGVPVIASTCVAPQGLMGAIRVCGPNREELREALRSVLALSDESRHAIGEKARTVGRAVFDWSVLAEQYAQLYTETA